MALPEPRLTPNQEKVIRDKYLRGAPSVAAWLEGVARNVALGELLADPRARDWGVRAGDARGRLAEAEAACAARPEAKDLRERWAERYYGLMSSWDFLPNSPTLMNAGRPLQQLSACYVLPVPDSLEGIMKAASAAALIQKSGGGTGFSFSRLRPAGAEVRGSSGTASGALSFIRLFDAVTETIKQGGTRRGANMAVLRFDHPEVLEFIRLKTAPGVLENFNVSVGIDAAFMEAVREDRAYALRDPRDGRETGRLRARDVLRAMAEAAWASGDPGFVVLDRINASGSNPVPGLGLIESTNPCGEVPLLPWEPCNLGSLNLANFVTGAPFAGRFDFARLEAAAALAVRFLDDVIEVNDYPLPETEAAAKGNRRIGLGVMGWAEALVKRGIPYDAHEALAEAETVMSRLDAAALAASEALGAERGVFPNWAGSIYDPASPHFRGQALRPRHCARTTIAPTGTIAIAAGLQGGGIEPFFALAYARYDASALEAVKAGRAPDPRGVYHEATPLLRAAAAAEGLDPDELAARVEAAGGSLRAVAGAPERLKRLFACAHDVSAETHLRMQAAFQGHVDNGVSKTVNLPRSATAADVEAAFLLAYELGCKGVTVYRDGSKSTQVLNAPAARCPACGSANVSFESGCGGPTCHDCGSASCS